jgi:SAM-dependent methyltransferase
MRPATYNPAIFHVRDIPQAMRIILTPDGASTEERWAKETPYLAELAGSARRVTADSVILDYGCGIGRLAKALIARFGCRVIGTDISPSMRALSVAYVESDRFFCCPPAMVDMFAERGLACDGALSVWVLQHCARPKDDIARLSRAIKRKGRLFIANNHNRVVPTVEHGWVDDGVDLKALLSEAFALREEGQLPAEIVNDSVATFSFWATFVRRG